MALASLVLSGFTAQAREKKPKHKKNQDLSANPLANVNSKQPDSLGPFFPYAPPPKVLARRSPRITIS